MKDIHIPPAALEAGAKALCVAREGNDEWWTLHMRAARAAFLAMVEHWPGMKMTPWWEFATHKRRVDLILPLPEKPDAET